MSRAARHLAACLLLVLLPFQAFAVSIATAQEPVVSCAQQMMQMEMDCCEDDTSACPAAGDCAVHMAAIALPVQSATTPIFPGSDAALRAPPRLHKSYIPDGLQRPPQVLV